MTNKQTIDGVTRAALEALKSAKLFIRNGIDLGFIRMPDADTPDTAHNTLPVIDKAIQELRTLLDAPAGPTKQEAWALQVEKELGIERLPAAQPQGEVERLREEIVRLKGWGKANQDLAQTCMEEVKAAREQHAKRDALLREAWDSPAVHEHMPKAWHDRMIALSTSAEKKPVTGYPNRLCHVDYTAHPYRCGCLKGDEEAQRMYDEHYGRVVAEPKPRGEAVAMSREQFEAWVFGREHPVYGWLDQYWFSRGDDPENYAEPYVQGLWVASQSLYAEQPAPSHSGDANEMVAKPLLAKTVRRAFICKGCEGVYADEAVSSCDCMCLPEFIEGEIRY